VYDSQSHFLRRVSEAGEGPELIPQGELGHADAAGTWTAHFAGNGQTPGERPDTETVAHLFPVPEFAFAWLPLHSDDRLGVLTLAYPRPHQFSQEERRVLSMFASQCAESLLNARFTHDLEVAYEKQKGLDRLKDQFITIASHEMRTPLTAVQGYLELMADYDGRLEPGARMHFVRKAIRACRELELLLSNILDAGRLAYDTARVKLEPVALSQAVTHVMEILETSMERDRRMVNVCVPSTLQVMADEGRLRQVILNLLSNALKYSPADSAITISASTDEKVTVSVRDCGPGIPQEDQPRLFERFVRLERDMNSPVRGAGLGLAICKQLVEAMGGHIWIESTGNPGEGSAFCFTLACAAVPLVEERASPERE
jgi:signal transduction histidine kinase